MVNITSQFESDITECISKELICTQYQHIFEYDVRSVGSVHNSIAIK